MNVQPDISTLFSAAASGATLVALAGAAYALNKYLHPYDNKDHKASLPDTKNLYPTISSGPILPPKSSSGGNAHEEGKTIDAKTTSLSEALEQLNAQPPLGEQVRARIAHFLSPENC